MEMTSPSSGEEENNYIIKPSKVVLIFMGFIGLVLTSFEAFNCDINSNIEEIWKMDLPQEKYPEAIQNFLRTAIAFIDLGRTITSTLYVVAYALLLYNLITEERPKLLLPWLYIGAIKNLFFEIIVILIASCLCCKSFSYLCINFIGCKFIGLGCSSYFWLNIRLIYKERNTRLVTPNVDNFVQLSTGNISTVNLILPTSYSAGNESFNESLANENLFPIGDKSKQILPATKKNYISAHLIKSETVFSKPRFSFDALMNRLENDWSMVQRLLVRRQAEKRMLTGLEGHFGNVCEALAIRACAFLALVPEHRFNTPRPIGPEGSTQTASTVDGGAPAEETVLHEIVLNEQNVPEAATEAAEVASPEEEGQEEVDEEGEESREVDLDEKFSIKYLSTRYSKTSTLTIRTINYGDDAIYNVKSVFSNSWEDLEEANPRAIANENDRVGLIPVLCDPSVVISLDESPGRLNIPDAALSYSADEMIFQADILSSDFYFSKEISEYQKSYPELDIGAEHLDFDDLISECLKKNSSNIIDVNFWNKLLSFDKYENEISDSEGLSIIDSEVYESTASLSLDEHKDTSDIIGENDMAISEFSFEWTPNDNDNISEHLSLIPQLSSSYNTGEILLSASFEEQERNQLFMKQIENVDKDTSTITQNKDNSCQTLNAAREPPIVIQQLKNFLNLYTGNELEQIPTQQPFVISPVQFFSNCWKNIQEKDKDKDKDKESENSGQTENKKNKRSEKNENTQTSPKMVRKRKGGVQKLKKKIHFFEKWTKKKQTDEIVNNEQRENEEEDEEDEQEEEDEENDSENNSISLIYEKYKNIIENKKEVERIIQRNLDQDEIKEYLIFKMETKLDQLISIQAKRKSSTNTNSKKVNILTKPQLTNIKQISENVNNLTKPGPSPIRKQQRPATQPENLRKKVAVRIKSSDNGSGTPERNRLTTPAMAGGSKMNKHGTDPIQLTITGKTNTEENSREPSYRLPSILKQERKVLYGGNERVTPSRNRVELSAQVVAKNMLPIFRTNAQIRNIKKVKIEQVKF